MKAGTYRQRLERSTKDKENTSKQRDHENN